MAFCSACGAPAEGAFCPRCGAAITGASTIVPPPSSTMPAAGLSLQAASALCYLVGFVTGIIFLALAPYNQDRRIRFHAFQSIFLNVAVILAHFAITAVSLMFHTVSFTLGALISSLHLLVSLGFFLVWLYVMWKSYQGEKVMLPYIGPMAERQAGMGDPTSTGGTIGRAA